MAKTTGLIGPFKASKKPPRPVTLTTKGLKAMKSIAAIALACAALVGCTSDADRASRNLSTAADNFEVNRRVVFYNGFTNDYMLSIEGLCSIGTTKSSKGIAVTCKVGPSAYKKHMLGLSDNVTYFVEQLEPVKASPYHYRVVFKPANIVPDIEFK